MKHLLLASLGARCWRVVVQDLSFFVVFENDDALLQVVKNVDIAFFQDFRLCEQLAHPSHHDVHHKDVDHEPERDGNYMDDSKWFILVEIQPIVVPHSNTNHGVYERWQEVKVGQEKRDNDTY